MTIILRTSCALICTGFGCSFFGTRQRMNQENAPGRSLRDLPSCARKLSAPAPPMFSRSQANSDFAFAFGSPNANTEVSRKQESKRFFGLQRTLVRTNSVGAIHESPATKANRHASGRLIASPYDITKNPCPICLPLSFQRQTQTLNNKISSKLWGEFCFAKFSGAGKQNTPQKKK